MAYPETFTDKLLVSCSAVALAIANESPVTPDHEQRVKIASELYFGGGRWNGPVTTDFLAQGYDDTTPVATMESRLGALIPSWINLGLA